MACNDGRSVYLIWVWWIFLLWVECTHDQTIKCGLDWTDFVSKWEIHYPELCLKRLPHLYSDYFPVLLDCGGIRGGHSYFKFKNIWLKTESFVGRARQGGPPIRSMAPKFHFCR